MYARLAADLIPRELAYRESDGLQVSLLWWKADNSLSVSVVDSHAAEVFAVPIDGRDALDVFDHPYAYAADPTLAGTGSRSSAAS